jgi:hypothetical protein
VASWRAGMERAGMERAGMERPGEERPGEERPGADPAVGSDSTRLVDAVRAALDDDLDTPGALAAIDAGVAAPGGPPAHDDLSAAIALLGVPV